MEQQFTMFPVVKNRVISTNELELKTDKFDDIESLYGCRKNDCIACIIGVLLSKYQYDGQSSILIFDEGKYYLCRIESIEEYFMGIYSKFIKSKSIVLEEEILDKVSICIYFEEKFDMFIKHKQVISVLQENGMTKLSIYATGISKYILMNMQEHFNNIIDVTLKNKKMDTSIVSYNEKVFIEKNNKLLNVMDDKLPIIRMFEKAVNENGNNIGVIHNEIEYSYNEINGKANFLANELKRIGVKKGDYIPVIMEKSIELVISLLAILKIGAIYCPIDINWPQARIIEVIDKEKSIVILTNRDVPKVETNIINVEYSKLGLCENIIEDIRIDDDIYVIFTSGTTGKPKGARNKNRGIVNRFLYMNKRYGIKKDDVILLTSNYAFDSSIWQILWPLTNGKKLIVPRHTLKFDIFQIIKLIEKYKVTITDFVPSVFNLLVDILEKDVVSDKSLESLRQLLIGGEAMSSEYIYKFKTMYPKCSITNTYGPVEASIGTVFYELPDYYIDTIPIGRPIDNVKTFVVNKQNQIMPLGAIGVLCLGGECVGSGYINEFEKNKNSFIKIDAGKMEFVYKTGDLVQINDEDNYDFYGRNDNQVKINGIRVEIHEIETLICEMSGMKNACVKCYGDEKHKYLCVYHNSNYSDKDIVNYLKEYLPLAMIPKFYVRMDEFPVNSNGKIDRELLKEPRKEHNNGKY